MEKYSERERDSKYFADKVGLEKLEIEVEDKMAKVLINRITTSPSTNWNTGNT